MTATLSKVRAAPVGSRRPCSQSWGVRGDTPSSKAKWAQKTHEAFRCSEKQDVARFVDAALLGERSAGVAGCAWVLHALSLAGPVEDLHTPSERALPGTQKTKRAPKRPFFLLKNYASGGVLAAAGSSQTQQGGAGQSQRARLGDDVGDDIDVDVQSRSQSTGVHDQLQGANTREIRT